ncbi:MAG: carbon monoxide dehydrogenase [Oscillospiraceae bacterium]|nr:carbon monoxide dehydrogenase [Oscillospiraceae bacterium]
MRIYDEIIRRTEELLSGNEARIFSHSPDRSAKPGKKNEFLLARESAYELGESSLSSVSYTAITSNGELVVEDRILLFGKDLPELSHNSPFARISILFTDDILESGDQAAYSIIKSIELKKYDVFPEGYMMRVSVLSSREQVRVSKSALKDGLSFEQVGNLFISKYKENKHVKAVTVIFVTLPEAPYAELESLAEESTKLTRALNHIIADLKMDCRACEWKPVCDEVDGMKELHSKMVGQQ